LQLETTHDFEVSLYGGEIEEKIAVLVGGAMCRF